MDSPADKVITLASLHLPRGQGESVGGPPADPSPDQQEALALYGRIRARLQEATNEVEGADVLITVQDREISRALSKIAEDAVAGRPLGSGGAEAQFAPGAFGGDGMGWLLSLRDWVRRDEIHPILRPPVTAVATLSGDFTVAMASDWGTGLYGAPAIARSIRTMAAESPFDLLMHLGDVYYAGTEGEIKARFLKWWPTEAGRLNRALNGNHEMYSGGFGYFDLILPAFGQKSSYFALQNEHWLLVGLDTAYVEHDVDEEQVVWLDSIIEQAGRRKVVLFSHHQPFSRWDRQGLKRPRLPQTLRRVMAARLITAWYWGHEHQCVVYDRHDRWGFHGRCLGNGGIPERRKRQVRRAPVDAVHAGAGDCVWRRLPSNAAAPGAIVLDGPNRDMTTPSDREMFGPHGFMTLEFTGAELTERVFRSDSTELYANTIG